LRWETLGYTILSLIAIYLSFDIGIDSGFKPFYLLFLPIIWAAARQGMSGAIISATLLQLELIIAMQTLGHAEISLPELQMLSLVMALIGFFIGGVVDEQRRTSEELRQSLRMAAAGEMAGALAHELNQPLTALSAYAAACEILINRGERGELLDQALRGMALESARSGQVVRRLRDFFKTGDTKLESVTLKEIICPVVSQYQEKGQQNNIRLEVGALPALKLLVDRLQIQVVLRNLLANAFEAVSDLAQPSRLVTVRCKTLSDAQVAITVQDNGPGLSKHAAESLFKPFHSTKSSGLGLGLVISRAIAETHGGSLAGIVADHGMFTLILPTHENKNHV
jgi:C4-dicarboxylate-specific signal transduction histidine kinase